MGTIAIPPTQLLPVGFRFQPTDKEVFDHFLMSRNKDKDFRMVQDYSIYVPDIDVTTLEPWELPVKYKAKLIYQKNDNEWWFFSARTLNQTTRRKTGSGKWSSTCADKRIMDGDNNQIMGTMKTFAFHYAQGSSYKRLNWILHEYHLSNLNEVLRPHGRTFFVLCRLNYNKDDKTKNKTGGEVGPSGFPEIDGWDVRQINDEISSRVRQRKRTIELVLPFGINQDCIARNEQQMHPQDNIFSLHQPQIREVSFNVPELYGSDSSPQELSWGSSYGSRSSNCVDLTGDIPSSSPEDPDAPLYHDDQLTRLLPGVVPHGISPLDLLLQQYAPSGDRDTTILALNDISYNQQPPSSNSLSGVLPAISYNQRSSSLKSLSGVVPAVEKEISAENRTARPQPSSPLSPSAVRSPVIVAGRKGFRAFNSPALAESFIKSEARSVKEQLTASNPHCKKISNVKIEEHEKLAQETTEELRPTLGSIFIIQNQDSLSFPPSQYLANIVVSLVVLFSICWQLLHL